MCWSLLFHITNVKINVGCRTYIHFLPQQWLCKPQSGVSRRGRSTSRSRRSLVPVDSPSDFNTPITKLGYYSPGQPTPPKFGDTIEHPSSFPVTSPAALTTPTPILLHKFMSPASVGTPDTDDTLEEKSPVNPFVNAPVAEASTAPTSNSGDILRAGLKKKTKKRTDDELVTGEYNWGSLWIIVLLVLLAIGAWWRYEKIKVGYCDEMTSKNQESSSELYVVFLYRLVDQKKMVLRLQTYHFTLQIASMLKTR